MTQSNILMSHPEHVLCAEEGGSASCTVSAVTGMLICTEGDKCFVNEDRTDGTQ